MPDAPTPASYASAVVAATVRPEATARDVAELIAWLERRKAEREGRSAGR